MKRPVLVTVIGVIMVVVGAFQMIFGGVVLAMRNDASFLADSGFTTGQATGLAVTTMVIGLLSVVLAVGLLKGSRASRGFIGFLELCQLGAGVYTVVALSSSHRGSGIGSIVGALVVLYFLFGTEKAKQFFAGS